MSSTCDNCGAKGDNFGKDHMGRTICCPHCVFNPLGCRCKYGEFGVAEDFDYGEPDEDDNWAEWDFSDYYEPEDRL